LEELTKPNSDSHMIRLKKQFQDLKHHLMEIKFTYQVNGPTEQLKKSLKDEK
jgi:hypothetical protein